MLLGSYWAKRCARRAHNEFDDTIPRVEDFEYPATTRARMDAGIDFEDQVRGTMAANCPGFLDLTGTCDSGAELIAATVPAMEAGIPVIAGGQLPDDLAGGRSGKPDLLVRARTPGADGSHRYFPADVKHHKTTDAGGDVETRYSTLARPAFEGAAVLTGRHARYREDDLIQLAHYWRMLQACGRAPDHSPIGGIAGSDLIDDGKPVIVWHELDAPAFRTFSRSGERGWTRRSALERHDHEHEFRVRIATAARLRTGGPQDPPPLVDPVYTGECDECPWFDYCIAQLGDDVSASVGGLDTREWLALREIGIRRAEDLAALDLAVLDDPDETSPTGRLLSAYLPEVRHQSTSRHRLRDAVIRAQMDLAGELFRRKTTDPISVPRADVEIDLDVETDRNQRVYLWGMLVTDRGTGAQRFEHVSSFDQLDESSEAALGARFWQRLRQLISDAKGEGKTVRVYHYAFPERSNLLRLAAAQAHPDLPARDIAEELAEDHFVDLWQIMRANFVGRNGLGLKVVATDGAGFAWRDEAPGGAESQLWLDAAYFAGTEEARSAARTRILAYNEDDVGATLAVREWLSSVLASSSPL